MTANIFNSMQLVPQMTQDLQNAAKQFQKQRKRRAHLTVVVAGHDMAAEIYCKQLLQSCSTIGIDCTISAHPFEIQEEELCTKLAKISSGTAVDGIILLLPLPEHIRQRIVTDALPPEKDVDGLSSYNAGNLLLGFPGFVPSTADVVLTVLQAAHIPIDGRNAVIVGRSNVGGKPGFLVLLRQNATVTICHSKTQNLAEITRNADILMVSVGQPAIITANMVKPGAVVLDAGINFVNGKVVGDVDFPAVREIASFLTPVPGGLGPLTHLMLIRHTLLGPQRI